MVAKAYMKLALWNKRSKKWIIQIPRKTRYLDISTVNHKRKIKCNVS